MAVSRSSVGQKVYAAIERSSSSPVESVLSREEHKKVHGLTVTQLDEVINSLVRISEPVQIRFLWRPLLSDPRDDMVLETAVNGRADLLVTFNQRDFLAAGRVFAHEVVRPSEALNRLRARTKRRDTEQGYETE